MSHATRAAAVLAAVAFALSGVASAKDVAVSFTGCTYAGVEAGCLLVTSGGKAYNITSARPRPGLQRAIAGKGIVSGNLTTCMQGQVLTDVHWRYVRDKMPCPKADRGSAEGRMAGRRGH
jgi:hypothetical protein